MTAQQAADEFILPLRVYIEDTDAGGVVYHANYLKFMERARSDWLRQRGMTQRQLQQQRLQFVVASCELAFLRPARLDDELLATASVSRLGRASVTFQQKIWRQAELLASAEVKVAAIDQQTMRPVSLPPALRQQLMSHGEKKTNGE